MTWTLSDDEKNNFQ